MSLKLLLTIDLNSVSEMQRNNFYDYLKSRNLIKTNLTTTWKASWNTQIAYETAVNVIKDILQSAATYAGVKNYEANFMISENEIVSIRK